MRSFVFGAVALVSTAALSACANTAPTTGEPSKVAYQPSATAAPAAPTSSAATSRVPKKTSARTPQKAADTAPKAAPATAKTKAKPAISDLSQLKSLGIDLNKGVLIDVADDGIKRYLQVGKNGVDFTGTTKTDSTMMALKAAPVREPNRVLIKPPFWNEEIGAGYCVADTSGAALKLEVCKDGRAAQVWTIVPAGDSGQFEMHGMHGIVRVKNGKITTGRTGRTGLQTIPFAS